MISPRQEIRYKAPRRLNAVSIVLILIALVIGYWFWRFFPSQFDAWTVDHILKEGAHGVYRLNRLGEPTRSQELRLLVDKARNDIVKRVGIRDPELLVNLNIDENKATMTADYHITITHPGIAKVTTLHFQREKSADIKFVKWE